VIRFENVTFGYEKDMPIIDSADLVLSSGLTLLLGPNGCGKSTLLKLASGVEKPDSGQITIEGRDLWKDEVAARRNLAYLPEQPDLTPYATLREIINLVCRLRGERLKAGEESLKFFGLHSAAQRTVRELSLGQRRRAVFAACLIGKPKYILLDEPLEGMDRSIQKEIKDWISSRTQAGAAVIVVSHFIEKFIDLVSQGVTVKDGQALLFPELPDDLDKKLAFLEELSKGRISSPTGHELKQRE
jgi:ABC-type multidrug transport system ATPase subunit